jgi:alpha-1,3-glucosyltransferase
VLGSAPAANFAQLMRRLVPLGRGLTHTYWAPNAWALYSATDRAAHAACRMVASAMRADPASCTRNAPEASLIDAADPAAAALNTNRLMCLPQVTPTVAAAAVLLAMLPLLLAVWRRPSAARLPLAVAVAWLAAFAFGWHVHEKAVLYALVPAWLAVGEQPALAGLVWALSQAAHVSLFPLIFTPLEQAPVALMTAAWAVVSWRALGLSTASPVARPQGTKAAASNTLSAAWRAYVAGLCAVWLLLLLGPRVLPAFPFLPLLVTSVYCAAGVLAAWLQLYSSVLAARTT